MNKINRVETINTMISEEKLAQYLEFTKEQTISLLPINGVKVFFNDDIWDFSSIDRLSSHYTKLDFTNIHKNYKNIIKWVISKEIVYTRKKLSTVYGDLQRMKQVVKFLVDENVTEKENISLSVIKKYVSIINNNYYLERLRNQHKRVFIQLLKQISYEYQTKDFSVLINELKKYDRKKDMVQRNNAKTEIIEKSYITSLIKTALEVIDSDVNNDLEVEEACTILLLSQTGMRIGELRLLEANMIKEIPIFEGNVSASYLEFKTFKTVRSNDFKWTYSFLNDIGKKAYLTLQKITEKRRSSIATNYLFCVRKTGRPISEWAFRRRIKNFVVRNFSKINCSNLKNSTLSKSYFNSDLVRDIKMNGKLPKDISTADKIYYPRPHQFRVTLVTQLYEKGVNIDWIREHMNHLSEEMTIHYIRFDQEKSRNDNLLKSMIKEIGTNNTEQQLVRKIDKFIKNNKLNVHTDIVELITELNKELPLREKEQGYCIKSSFGRKCPKNEITDIKENLYIHLANCEFLDLTYNRFKKIQKTIEYNISSGFIIEADREKKRLDILVNNYLIPEFNDLLNEIEEKGVEKTLIEYPNLVQIIKYRSEIRGEIECWIPK